jgi:hypothetical protein
MTTMTIERVQVPAYFAFGETDQVVSPLKTHKMMARWGGAVREDILVQGPPDDEMGHIMAGDVFSPNQTAPLAQRIIDWARDLSTHRDAQFRTCPRLGLRLGLTHEQSPSTGNRIN